MGGYTIENNTFIDVVCHALLSSSEFYLSASLFIVARLGGYSYDGTGLDRMWR